MHSFQPANFQISREKLRLWIINLYKKKRVQGNTGHDKKLFSWDDASLSTTFRFFTDSFCFYLWQKARDHYNHYHSLYGWIINSCYHRCYNQSFSTETLATKTKSVMLDRWLKDWHDIKHNKTDNSSLVSWAVFGQLLVVASYLV